MRKRSSGALWPLRADSRSQRTVTAGSPHFFAAWYLVPSGLCSTRWVLANMSFFWFARRTK